RLDQLSSRLDQLIETVSRIGRVRRDQAFDRSVIIRNMEIVGSNPTTDLELIERFAHSWEVNGERYRESLASLRHAAERLLPILEGNGCIADPDMQRLLVIQEHVACLARQPLFYPEMFHGVRLLPCGGFAKLSDPDSKHLRASGLLGAEDRMAITKI